MTCQGEALDRVFIEIGPFTIYWYGLIIASAIFIGLYLATKEAEKVGMQKDIPTDLLIFAAPIAIIFADRKSVV